MQSLGRAPLRPLPVRRDPAPTRWQYRMQRLWLTPESGGTMRAPWALKRSAVQPSYFSGTLS